MAGRIPQSFINDLIDRVDIVDVVERRMTLKKSGKNYSGLCPFHDEKTPSFTVSPDKQFFHCFGCQESGTALTFVMKFDRLEFVEAVEAMAQQMGLEVPREQSSRGYETQIDPDLWEVLGQAERYYRSALRDAPQAIEYLKKRGLTGEIARDFGIGYAPDGWQNLSDNLDGVSSELLLEAGLANTSDNGRVYDRFRDRVVFPIKDTRGRTIGFGGRIMGSDGGPKYLNSPETPVFHKGKELYGLYEARRALRSIDSLLVVEGYMDVIALAQHGFANAVATLGTASGTPHFEKLYRYTDEVICCFDGDQAGRQAAWKALENALPTLNEHRQLKLMFLPDGEDPDSIVRNAGADGFRTLMNNATPGLEFLLSRLGQGLDMQSIDGKARFAGLIQPYLDKVPPGVLHDILSQRVNTLTGLRQAPERARVSAPKANKIRPDKISERLLTYFLKHPAMWTQMAAERRAEMRAHMADSDLIGLLASYLDEHPQADTEELLVVFSDEPLAAELDLSNLANKPDAVATAALPGEFADICTAYLRKRQELARREALLSLKESPNVDELRKYWQRRTGDDD